jgi:protein JSN1
LASDYLGNTIIQKLYASASPNLRLAMLERIAPHLALIGTNKHGTWAAQAIIDRATSPEEMALIARNLAPYVPPLSADSYGNYLVSAW